MIQPLVKALSVEQNPLAGAELVRAIALILGSQADDALFENMPRFDSRAGLAWVEVVERTRPADLLPRLEKLPTVIGATMGAYAVAHPDELARAFASMPSDSALEKIYVSMAAEWFFRDTALPWPVLSAGITAGGAPRRTVVRDLLWRRLAGLTVPAETDAALADLTDHVTGAEDPSLAVSLELSRRTQPGAGTPRPIGDAIAAMAGWDLSSSPPDPLLRMLSADEERALRALPASSLPPRGDWTKPRRVAFASRDPGVPTSVSRFVRPLTPGVLADILAISGCKPGRDRVAAIDVSYRPSGQVRDVSQPFTLGFKSEGCGDAARVLAVLDIATGHAPVPAARTDLVLVGLRPDDLECKRSTTKRSGKPATVGANLQQPKKTRNVQPHYPEALIAKRQQGVVVIEALVSTEGCVAEAEVVRSADISFNAEALIAVSQWRYTPTILNGEEVPVIMTVTVNFVLQ